MDSKLFSYLYFYDRASMYRPVSDDTGSEVSSFSDIHVQAPKEDSTRAWVICSFSFFLFFIVGGFMSSTGIFIEYIADDVSVSTSFLGFMFSSVFGFVLIVSGNLEIWYLLVDLKYV